MRGEWREVGEDCHKLDLSDDREVFIDIFKYCGKFRWRHFVRGTLVMQGDGFLTADKAKEAAQDAVLTIANGIVKSLSGKPTAEGNIINVCGKDIRVDRAFLNEFLTGILREKQQHVDAVKELLDAAQK